MDTNDFVVEGRYFDNTLYAFTFAQIQADRMERPVEVHVHKENLLSLQDVPSHVDTRTLGTWHATAHPSDFVRRHLVKEGVPQ